jgi:hypothetical protein
MGLRGKYYIHFMVVIYSCSDLSEHVSLYFTSENTCSGNAIYLVDTQAASMNCLIHRPKGKKL